MSLPLRSPRARAVVLSGLAALLLVAAAAAFGVWSDQRDIETRAAALTGGDPRAGRDAIERYGCGSCHTIPGVRGAHAMVGPPLTAFGKRIFIAGKLHNAPENVVHWIVNPQDISPATAMPNTGVTDGDARDITAYLYTLR